MTTPSEVDLHDLIHRAWQCVVGNEQATYLSGPITTGLRFVETIVANSPEHVAINQNLEALRSTAKELRRSTNRLVIDPSPLTVPHWSQEQYMMLWRALIQRRASEVRFMPDWEYSLGCTLEFLHAKQLDIPTLTIEGLPVSVEEGLSKLKNAATSLAAISEKHPRIKPLAANLTKQLENIANL